jgi:hypothetical protein
MAPQSNPDSPPAGAPTGSADSPSADDLMALVPDMELLETSAIDARTAQTAVAAALGSGRKPTITPKLSDQNAATTARTRAPNADISDDPYADLMPELEPFEAAPAPAAKPQPAVPRAVPPPARAPVAAAARPVASPRPTTGTASASANPAPPVQPKAPPAARPAPPPPPPSSKKPANPEDVAVPPVMNREFIARNRIVELYLSGGLPIRSATVFEKFCEQNPKMLDEIGLPERVHAALRLLEATGKPEPWQQKPKRFWEQPYVLGALSGLVLVLGVATLMANKQVTEQTHKAAALQQLVSSRPIDAAAGTSTVYIQPTRSGPAAVNSAIVGGAAAQLVNIKIDMSHSDFRAFRITIDRVNQGRVAVLNNVIKDSNGALGFSLNSSALGPDTYPLTIEGLDWRGDPQPDSWAAISIRR